METKNELKDFIHRFFTNLKCQIIFQENLLKIDKIPADFENFYGKRAPYMLAFDIKDAKSGEDSELITKGSPLIRAITNYLESSGQTTLLKINFPNPEEQIKKYLKFHNCEILNITKKIVPEHIIRFTFSTSLQYLNEKEQRINNVFTDKEKVIDFDLEDYEVSEGKKEEILLKEVKPFYLLAKEKLKVLLEKKTNEIGNNLNIKLDREINRINEHYSNLIKEITDQTDKNKQQLEDSEKQLKNPNAKDKDAINSKIKRINEHLKAIEKENKTAEFEKEKEFFINDEIHKHSLNIQNRLINTTIIYFPIFHISLFLKGKEAGRQIEVIYNPMKKELQSVNCETCNQEISEIVLCSSGHIVCRKCGDKCRECNRIICKKCFLTRCSLCGKEVCKKCISKCAKCNKSVCKSHLKKDEISGKEYCSDCLRKCSSCGSYASKENIAKCPSCGREICRKCQKMNLVKSSGGKTLCSSCSKKCASCGELSSINDFKMCLGCSSKDCSHLNKCMACRRQLCVKLRKKPIV